MTFSDYINNLLKYGKNCFSVEQAEVVLKKSRKAITSAIRHLVAKGELVSPAKGFYVIVPPEYRILGCLPPDHFIPYLMEYWHCPYYVGLLSAASHHGASHQAAQIFQVMVPSSRRPIVCGKVRIQFITNQHFAEAPVQKVFTTSSQLTISTPEGTAMDLLNYPRQAGGLNHIVTVLAELHEAMDPERLLALAESVPVFAWQQRLGYLLEIVGANDLAKVLKIHLAKQQRVDYVSLMPKLKFTKETPRNKVWKIIENTTVESDI